MHKSRTRVRLLPGQYLTQALVAAKGMMYDDFFTLIEQAYWKAWDKDETCVPVIIKGVCMMVPWEAFEVREIKE